MPQPVPQSTARAPEAALTPVQTHSQTNPLRIPNSPQSVAGPSRLTPDRIHSQAPNETLSHAPIDPRWTHAPWSDLELIARSMNECIIGIS